MCGKGAISGLREQVKEKQEKQVQKMAKTTPITTMIQYLIQYLNQLDKTGQHGGTIKSVGQKGEVEKEKL